jgi:hypothetical protein
LPSKLVYFCEANYLSFAQQISLFLRSKLSKFCEAN